MPPSLDTRAPIQKVPLSPEPLYRLIFGRPVTQILYTALDLGVFEILSEGPSTLDVLCGRMRAPVHSGEMLVNTCVALGLLKKSDDGYENTPLAAHYLVSASPFYLGGLLGHFRHHVYPAWDRLNEAIQEDGPQMSDASSRGKTHVFNVTQQVDRDTELFIAAMHNLSVSDGLLLADAFDFSRFSRMVDLGGGSGALSVAVASRFRELDAVVLDRPAVCALADRYIRDAGLSPRVRTLAGDAFATPFPPGTDLILMSLFIHAFGLERSTPLLRRCWEALPPGGGVLIYEPVLAPSRTEPFIALLSSLNMLVVTPSGGDVTAEDYQRWLSRNGFIDVFYTPVPSLRHLIGGFKPR